MYAKSRIFCQNLSYLYELWNKKGGLSICNYIIFRKKILDIFKYLMFDKKNRAVRLKSGNFCYVNSASCYKPGLYIIVEEQLFPRKARCPKINIIH